MSPREVGDLWELLEIGDLKGGLYIPGDGQIDPTGVTLALAKGARRGGVRIFENNAVTGIRLEKGRAVGVETIGGNISCELVVNCAGMWAREFGRMAGATIPLLAVEHMYMITEPMPNLKTGHSKPARLRWSNLFQGRCRQTYCGRNRAGGTPMGD